MRLVLGQLNPLVGDLTGNARRILEAAQQAQREGARLLLTPELSLGLPAQGICCCNQPA